MLTLQSIKGYRGIEQVAGENMQELRREQILTYVKLKTAALKHMCPSPGYTDTHIHTQE